MSLGENTLHPLQIEDARDAAFRASELQRGVEDRMRQHSRELAAAERAYRTLLSTRMLALHAEGYAITTCETLAKGEREVAELRYKRDIAKGIHEATRQESFRRGADRTDTNSLLEWSQRRDLRTEIEPNWAGQPSVPAVRAA